MIKIIACISQNGVIGNDNSIIWNLPPDMKRFKELTNNHNIIMGRKTFESIGKPLSNRVNIVISKDFNYKPDGVIVFNSLWSAINYCNSDCFIIGGSQIYELSIEIAHEIYLTIIHSDFSGDAYFPKVRNTWKIKRKADYIFNNLNYSFIDYERKR
jgi:dihydrofolate reductase